MLGFQVGRQIKCQKQGEGIAKQGQRRGAVTIEHRGTEEVSPSSQNGEHDIRYPHPQEGAQARAQGRLSDRASRPKI